MKILHIMAGRGLGGAETYACDVMLSLHRAGIDQCVVMSIDAPRFVELKEAGLQMAPHVLRWRWRFLQRLRLKRLIAQQKPTYVQSWMRRAASLLPKFEGSDTPVSIGWFGGYYEPRHFARCSVFVGVTRDIVAHMQRKGVPVGHAHFLPTFPDIVTQAPVNRANLATPREAKVLLTLSRLHPKKGLDLFLHALVRLPDCYAWLAGEGPSGRELESLAAKLGVMDRVRFLGWRTDRSALLRAADVCVLPSRYEPFGTVILEAWAAGTPLVACKSAGPAAHIDDGVTGLLAGIDNEDELVAAIRRAIDDEDLRRRLVAQGYATYIKSYTREAVTQQWIDLYRKLVA